MPGAVAITKVTFALQPENLESTLGMTTLMQKVCLYATIAMVAGTISGAVLSQQGVLPKASFSIIVFGNLAQTLILVLAVIVMGLNIAASRAAARFFWILMTVGCIFWAIAQAFWVYYEVYLRVDVPDPSLVDSVFFLHIVPMMGAIALRPHTRSDHRGLNLGWLDFTLLLIWWVYVYSFVVIPWQYISIDPPRYARSFNILYVFEQLVLVVGLAYLCWRSRGTWRTIYAHLLGASFVYLVSSRLINYAIDHDIYFTGSVYDIPLVVSMGWFVWAGIYAARHVEQCEPARQPAGRQGVWPARLAMIAILSLPGLGIWAMGEMNVPPIVREFRLLLTLGAILCLTFLLFMKQHWMDREMIRLLSSSRESFEGLQRLQTQLVHSEKMASLGQLVAGAAHEINNPLTAILGYADILASHASLVPEHRALLVKIEQQARRTKTLVSHLLSFAKQVPVNKTLVSIDALLRNAVKLREVDLNARQVRVEWDVAADLPYVWGDANQLLQVCYHILNNAMDALHGMPGGMIHVSARMLDSDLVIAFSDNGHGVKDPQRIFDPFYTTKPVGKGVGLGLSACYGIIQEHEGEIACVNRPEGGATISIRLPVSNQEQAAGVAVR